MNIKLKIALIGLLMATWVGAPIAAQERMHRQVRIGEIAHPKGLETSVLHGMGLVVGLNGTGDASLSTPEVLASFSLQVPKDLKNSQHVTLAYVTATVPAAGARQGSKIDCQVSAIGAESLVGGTLVMTQLRGSRPDSKEVMALAFGAIELDKGPASTRGKIQDGCQLEVDIVREYVRDGKVALVLDKEHTGFDVAQAVADQINTASFSDPSEASSFIARAKDSVSVEVIIPKQYSQDPVLFVQQILDMTIIHASGSATNELVEVEPASAPVDAFPKLSVLPPPPGASGEGTSSNKEPLSPSQAFRVDEILDIRRTLRASGSVPTLDPSQELDESEFREALEQETKRGWRRFNQTAIKKVGHEAAQTDLWQRLEAMQPNVAKDHLLRTLPATFAEAPLKEMNAEERDSIIAVVTALKAMGDDKSKRIIAEFKNEKEAVKLVEILRLIRLGMPEVDLFQ